MRMNKKYDDQGRAGWHQLSLLDVHGNLLPNCMKKEA